MAPVDARAALREALAAEQTQQWAQSMVLCGQALADSSQHPDAFNLFGRLCWAAGDAANAIASQRHVLRLAPHHARAAEDLSVASGAVLSHADAAAAYRSAVTLHPDVACHHRDPGSLRPFAGMDRVEQALRRAIDLDPSFAPAHAAIGNIRAREDRGREAVDAYRLAVMLDWDWADAHLALAAFYDKVRDDGNASLHRLEALSRKQVYAATGSGDVRRVLVLTAPGDPTANAPLDYCVDPERVALHRYYLVDGEPTPELPPYDLVFNGMEEAETSAPAITRAAEFVASQSKPVLNDPRQLANVRRSALAATLRGVAGCATPPTRRVRRDALERGAESIAALGFGFSVLVRPVDTHRGDWQGRVSNAAELHDYLTRAPGTHFNVSPFVDYRSDDGYFRKYRVIVVGGTPFPYHLAISGAWKVHYHSSLMEQHGWMRDEERRFFEDPRSVFRAWDTVFGDIASAVKLDYFGVDCARGADGSVLVFECGPGMLVHCIDSPDLFGYKHERVPRIFAALDELFERAVTASARSLAQA